MTETRTTKYIYGPVKSWRSGTSLGVDPIGEISTCSFNCSYCQLGQIQNITSKTKEYVKTQDVLEDLDEFDLSTLDVITFAGSGEPTLAANLDEMILGIQKILKAQNLNIPISILSNATMFNDPEIRKKTLLADLVSIKLDAPNNEILRSINQPAEGISIESIVQGIKLLKKDMEQNQTNSTKLQLQIMFMPKFAKNPNYINDLAHRIIETGITNIQINTPTRPKPKGKEFHIETRGNHYAEGTQADYEFIDLPVISEQEAFEVEDKLKEIVEAKLGKVNIINVYKR